MTRNDMSDMLRRTYWQSNALEVSDVTVPASYRYPLGPLLTDELV